MKKDLKVLSLFSGCGGMDLGMEGGFKVHSNCVNLKIHSNWKIKKSKNDWVFLPPTRFKTIFANDIRPGAKKTWSHFFKNNPDSFKLESVVDLVNRYLNGEKDLFPKSVDVVTGGFPCQDFSIAGNRKGFYSNKNHDGLKLKSASEQNRGKLYIWMRDVIAITRPKIFVAENVKGLASLGEVKKIIEKDFEKMASGGYLILPAKILHAANFGVPQSRERIFFIGVRKDAIKNKIEIDPTLFFPNETHSDLALKKSNLKPFVSLSTILRDLKEPCDSKDLDQQAYSRAKWYGNHCQGNKEIDLKRIAPTIRSEHHGNIEFRRLSKSHGGLLSHELKKGLKERRLTIRECARIQTFPDNYQFSNEISPSEAYKLIGNAVPPLLAYHFAKRIESIWDHFFL